MLKIRGRISKRDRDDLESLYNFVLDKFMSKRLKNNIHVDLKLNPYLLKRTGHHGEAIWEDTHRKGREFSIELEKNIPRGLLMSTFAHELIHVKQWALGEFYQEMRRTGHHKFLNKSYNINEIDYWDLPWEIEAYGRSVGLVVRWVRETERKSHEYREGLG